MGHNDIKLILTDIDGTILPYGQPVVDDITRTAFHHALEAGIRVGPCSGRGREWLVPLFEGDEACYATAISTNGLQVYLDDRCIHEVVFDPGDLGRVLSYLEGLPHAGLLCFVHGEPHLASGTREDLAVAFPRYADPSVLCVDEGGIPEGPVGKANVFLAKGVEETRELVERLNRDIEGLDFDLPQPGFINVMPAGYNKGSAIDLMCQRLGCSREEVVVFGDAGNDLTMLRHVPNSVAVANATSDAAAAARWHIGSCDEHAVAAVIEKLAAGEWPFA